MSYPWFRLYSEFASDPKIQSMDETSQRRFVIVLCLQCDGTLKKLSETEIACAMRISEQELSETKELFIKKGFIDAEWNVLNWDKRQYKSDTSKERTRKWRENKSVTSQRRHEDTIVTAPDTDTDTDNKKKINKRKTAAPDIFPITEQMKQYFQKIGNHSDLESLTEDFLLHHRKKGNQFSDWYAAWQTWARNDLKYHPEHKNPPPDDYPVFDDLSPEKRYKD